MRFYTQSDRIVWFLCPSIMEFFRRSPADPLRLGIFPGSFNPVTVAHLGLAHAALSAVDEVVFVLPRLFPHKSWEGAPFSERIAMLQDALAEGLRFSLAVSEGGLFREIAAECRAVYPIHTRLSFLCGADAAERIVHWDYGDPSAIARMLGEFDLLVAARGGDYLPPPALRHAISTLPVSSVCEGVSASEVRRRIATGEDWEALVPPAIHASVCRLYGRA